MDINIVESDEKTNSLGGLVFIYEWLLKMGIPQIIDETLGNRSPQAQYSYSDVIISFILNLFAGAQRLEHSYEYKDDLDNIEGVTIPSPDTTGRIIKQLAVRNLEIEQDGENGNHRINRNIPLLNVLMQTTKKLGLISNDTINVVDYDATVIAANKYDANVTFKQSERGNIVGYQPAMANINGFPIYVEGRSGHTNASFGSMESLHEIVKHCHSSGIRVHRYRADSGSYNFKLFEYCKQARIEFFVRGKVTNQVHRYMNEEMKEEDWVIIDDSGAIVSLCSVPYTSQYSKDVFRVVVKRIQTRNKVKYSAIITNNYDMSDYDIYTFYNMRGAEEKRFAELKREFNLTKIPFSFLEENTAFMTLCCLAYNIYRKVVGKVQKFFKKMKANSWLKILRKYFIKHTLILTNTVKKYRLSNYKKSVLEMFRQFLDEI